MSLEFSSTELSQLADLLRCANWIRHMQIAGFSQEAVMDIFTQLESRYIHAQAIESERLLTKITAYLTQNNIPPFP